MEANDDNKAPYLPLRSVIKIKGKNMCEILKNINKC